ncbi:hypoxanthine phosphoribosyltransferase [Desulfosudis oleivorans]|uniref:Hypoxanthine phosphoribosyltransferase n=1 Tax=Desulfosudis oleivorans (strain DSM 6200 / JCM 39069 / Hxd3) TaxID=96561 RepID=A8ZYX2_DESOH|nr:hypoxanthine phosphoribosyltransferase [Desulfosudis oleivorans]ABW67227.1 hypoxanthine phosphoribosyltransferase [Desulfosudis oleivorans Hxd3]
MSMPELVPVLSAQQVEEIVVALGQRISSDFGEKGGVAVCVLKGAFVFFADLIRTLTIPVEVDFVGVASYGAQTESSGNIELTKPIESDITGRQVLVVEDIVDTGATARFLLDYLGGFEPARINLCAFLDKRERRNHAVRVDYSGHVVRDGFLVGYGLDWNGCYRNLKGIHRLEQNNP